MRVPRIPGTTPEELFYQHHVWSLGSLACDAAIELDNERLERNEGFVMGDLLVRWLRSVAEQERGCFSSEAMAVIWPLLRDKRVAYTGELTHKDHLIEAIEYLAARLEHTIRHPKRHRRNNCAGLNAMRDFCLQLSRIASAWEWEQRGGKRFLYAA